MIAQGQIISFIDIFKFIPKTVVANDIKKKGDRFTYLINHVEEFTLKDLFTIARLCNMTKDEMWAFIKEQIPDEPNNEP
jgi:hypothetical protein